MVATQVILTLGGYVPVIHGRYFFGYLVALPVTILIKQKASNAWTNKVSIAIIDYE